MALSRREFVIAGSAALLGARQEARKYRACVIGHTGRGGYGHGLDTCFKELPNITVTAVADPDEKGRAAAQKKIGAERAYADYREMLAKEKPGLVSIGPRWVEHRLERVAAAAEGGAHIYTEKPIAGSLEEADAIVALTEKHGIRMVIAHQVRVAPVLARLKKLVDDGLIGDLREIRTRGKEDKRSGGEDLMVLGTHCMYLMRHFAGDPLWCSARITQEGREITAEDRRAATEPLGPVAGDSIQASFAFPNGVMGHFASQKNTPVNPGRFQIHLHGSKGVLAMAIEPEAEIFHLDDPSWSPGKSGAKWQPAPGTHEKGGTALSNRRIVEELLRWIETGTPSSVGLRDGRWALEMILSVYASHLAGARATFPLKNRKHPLGDL